MDSPEIPRSLSRTLRAWRVQPHADPDFRPAVWNRIAQRSRASWAHYVHAHRLAWSVAAALAIGGAGWGGRTAAKVKIEAERQAMAEVYLVGLDPRVQAKLWP